MSYQYGWAKLSAAVTSLTEVGTQGNCVHEPFSLIACRRFGRIRNYPRSCAQNARSPIAAMTCKHPVQPGDGKVEATVRVLSAAEMHAAIEKVISLYDHICRYMPIILRNGPLDSPQVRLAKLTAIERAGMRNPEAEGVSLSSKSRWGAW